MAAAMRTSRFAAWCAAGAMVLSAAAATAQTTAGPDAAHLAAVKRLLKASGIGRNIERQFRESIVREGQAYPQAAALLTEITAAIDADGIEQRIAPLYAAHISRSHADANTSFFESPDGREVVAIVLAAQDAEPDIPPALLKRVAAFAVTPAGRAFTAARKAVTPQIRTTIDAWRDELLAARLTSDPNAAMTVFAATHASLMDRLVAIGLRYRSRMAEAVKAFRDQLEASRLAGVVAPERLVSPAGIAESRRSLALAEESLELFLRTVDALQKAQTEELRAVEAPEVLRARLLAGFESALSQNYDLQLRFAENQRTLVDIFRRILALAEQVAGKLKLESGRLVFDETRDLESYRALAVQAQNAVAEEVSLLKEAAAAGQRSADIFNRMMASSPRAGAQTPAASAPGADAPSAPARPPLDTSLRGTTLGERQPGYTPSPRHQYANRRVSDPRFAAYVENVFRRLDRLSAAAGSSGAPGGEVMLTISVRANGTIEEIRVNRSSGSKALDDAAVARVRGVEPFDAFDAEMRRILDILSITATLPAK